MNTLATTLERLFAGRRSSVSRYTADVNIAVGLETRLPEDHYYWDGMKRGADPAHPFLLIQYTLDGEGCYEDGRERRRLPPEHAFVTVLPSPHRYFLPDEARSWRFFYVMLQHPYIVRRIAERLTQFPAVVALEPHAPVVTRLVRLFEGVCHDGFRDEFAQEDALFSLLIEYERFAHQRIYPQAERERLFEDTRRFALTNPAAPPDVSTVAAQFAMSRTHFSHHFKAATGISPARFLVQVRLEEVARQLRQTDLKLEALAESAGFADANHLCKVFRKHYHLSPGEYRRQVR